MSIPRRELKRESLNDNTTGRRLPAVHPGAVLLADFIVPMGITRYRVAKTIGVRHAASAKYARASVPSPRTPPDVLVGDIGMPDTDGFGRSSRIPNGASRPSRRSR